MGMIVGLKVPSGGFLGTGRRTFQSLPRFTSNGQPVGLAQLSATH